jgi:hypothetical protein
LASVGAVVGGDTLTNVGTVGSSFGSGVSTPTLGSGTTGIDAVGSTGIGLNTSSAAAAVPEPSAIALALFALAAAGFAIRRRVA